MVEFVWKVDPCGRWLQQTVTTNVLIDSENVIGVPVRLYDFSLMGSTASVGHEMSTRISC